MIGPLSALLLAASATSATHLRERRDEWQPTDICIYMTSEPDWHGKAHNMCAVPSYCGNTIPDGLTGNVSSAGPDKGTTCFLYTEENCAGRSSDPIVWPGYGDLTSPLIDFSKRARSWKCWKWCGYFSDNPSSSSNLPAGKGVTHTISISGIPAAPATGPVSITRTLSDSDLSVSALSTPSLSSVQITTTVTWEVTETHTFGNGNVTVVTTNLAS